MAEAAAPGARYDRALVFIFITIVINSMGIGLIMPVMPELLIDLTDGASIGEAAAWGGWLTASFALMQFALSPTLGNLSDAYGRRPVLMLSLLVMAVDYAVMALADSIWLLLAARIVAGGASATFSTANAFIADISPPEKRAQNFGLTGAAFGLGFVLGPAIGGVIGEFGPRMPFAAAAALTFANAIFGYLVLPETLTPARRRRFSLARANPVGVLVQALRYPAVAWMLLSLLIYSFSHYVWPAVWSYFATERFSWSPLDIGLSLAVVGLSWAFVQGYLIRRIVPRLGERRTAMVGFGFDVATLLVMAFITQGWMVYAFAPLTALSAMVSPAMHGIMSNLTPDDAQGELQGAIAAVTSLAFVVTPVAMTQLFFLFSGGGDWPYFPGAPFLAAAVFSALAVVPFVIAQRRT